MPANFDFDIIHQLILLLRLHFIPWAINVTYRRMAASRAFQVKLLYHRRLLPDALADSTSLLLVQILGVGSGAAWPKTDLAVADGPAIARKLHAWYQTLLT